MTAGRRTAGIAALGFAPLILTVVVAGPAAAHGSMADPVSRVAACFAEGPESPTSAACEAAVEAGGPQAFYDWNEVNIPQAAGEHRRVIPDGKLCSAGRDKYKGLDLARADWPAGAMTPGKHTFRYKATAPHKGTFELYLTKEGYDPAKPLKWSDLESEPFAKATDPSLEDGSYVIEGTVPKRSGRHLVYAIWQRSDSPEAFYSCSDVTFGGGSATASKDAPSAPDEQQIEAGSEKSTVDHGGHGGDGHGESPRAHASHGDAGHGEAGRGQGSAGANAPAPDGRAKKADLAQTGGDESAAPLALGGAAVVAAGAGVLLATARRRAARSRR
ncbi:lytic polysaccharide monooxygenase auxiliary activity family 9 protein [Streptomyces reniochalinae]|uniref:LPXTG cell wall anchor domain-containing protein n=1 Tax=Streptomyces reniochalinae TaxID=2250578 RepID=A0A367F6G8_9ACTN|nr:lytic polysaccharide monooxygenase [Streptomyces reniochalinae]RCG25140.1 LPXTG cell wall anchor domain-containing protein [Streptomyces reniochalinae]